VQIGNPIQNSDDAEQKRLQAEIFEYVNDQKLMLQKLLEFKNTLKNIMPLKLQERTYYTNFSKFLTIYEL
jgi:predicted helicase